nr:MAG TPA: hypothetical protein [Caudoviricetes sp.]
MFLSLKITCLSSQTGRNHDMIKNSNSAQYVAAATGGGIAF